ncbi:Type 1 glutamine amidotransferase-like domain-containing protein [Candidatus Woesebacteria bacterium]|nr:Type 1 glutamine amidotransferase-like domain-containing protein [Candidatus Woesebacteria bacterium]
MKLFLASLASTTLDLVLPLLPDKPNNLKVAFIPTAADPYGDIPMPWMDADRNKLVGMGFAVSNYDLKGKSIDVLRSELADFHVIFVAGGNVYYLLDIVKKTGFDIVIKELLSKGVVYIGASAGSVIMCPTIDHTRIIEHPEAVSEMIDFSGLSLVDSLIGPHYGNPKYSQRYEQIIMEWGDKLLLLRDNQALVVNDDKIKVVTI